MGSVGDFAPELVAISARALADFRRKSTSGKAVDGSWSEAAARDPRATGATSVSSCGTGVERRRAASLLQFVRGDEPAAIVERADADVAVAARRRRRRLSVDEAAAVVAAVVRDGGRAGEPRVEQWRPRVAVGDRGASCVDGQRARGGARRDPRQQPALSVRDVL